MPNPPRHPLRAAALQACIAAVAAILVVATWVATRVAVELDQTAEVRQATTQAANLALSFEEQVHRQLLAVDQTLRILKLDWERDPAGFDLAALQRRSGSLSDVLAQVLVLDARGRVYTGTRRDLIEADLSGRRSFQVHRHSDTDGAFTDAPTRSGARGAWSISLSRRLNAARGVFAGVVMASYDLSALTRELAQADLGPRGLVALVGRDGKVRALVNRVAREPGDDISASALYAAAFGGAGANWTGPSPFDGVERIHAFRALPGQDMSLIVGLDRGAALAAADRRGAQARLAASGITALLALVAVGLCWTVGTAHRREQGLARDRATLAAANLELKLARDAAAAKSVELETTFAAMSDGVSQFDREMRLVQWNHRFADFAGVPPDALRVGLTVEEVLRIQAEHGEFGPLAGPAEVEREVASRLAQIRAQSGEIAFERQRPDGTILELRRSPLPDGGSVTLYTDITARKRAEEGERRARELAERTAEEKSRFVAIVSHEVRTPLNVALNAFGLLDRSRLDVAQRRLVDTGLQAGEALLCLLNDILDLSRIESGHLALRPEPFALRPLLSGVAEMFGPQAAQRGVHMCLDVGPDVPQEVLTDSGRLRQILLNFAGNAAKFADPGRVWLRAHMATEAGRPHLRLAVRDEGPEIPDLDRARLFRPFSQLGQPGRAGAGTGLGLAICQLLANLLGGQVGCEPVGGGGKEFWLLLPLDEAALRPAPASLPALRSATAPAYDGRAPAGGAQAGTALPAPLRRARVLLVEDMVANQMVVATILRQNGHLVDVTSSGEAALPLVATQPYDLVFMDIFMPGIDGLETARRIRAMPGHAGRVPIVALTANVSPADRAEYEAAGIDGMVAKPVDRAAMLAAIARHVWGASSAAASPAVPALVPTPAPRAPDAGRAETRVDALDRDRLAGLGRGLPHDVFASLVEDCLTDLRDRLPLLLRAAADGDAARVGAVAHAMAGVSGTYGLTALEACLRRLMADPGRAEDLPEVERALARAERALAEVVQTEAV